MRMSRRARTLGILSDKFKFVEHCERSLNSRGWPILGARAPAPATTPQALRPGAKYFCNLLSRFALIAGEGARAPSETKPHNLIGVIAVTGFGTAYLPTAGWAQDVMVPSIELRSSDATASRERLEAASFPFASENFAADASSLVSIFQCPGFCSASLRRAMSELKSRRSICGRT